MTKNQVTKLIEGLPSTLDQLNEVLDDQQIVMIDFMDGDQVLNIRLDGDDQYTMIDTYGCDLDTVDKEHLLQNSLKS
jgi:hypothetical protein